MITITQGGIDFPPRVTIERTAKGEIVYSVAVPHKSVRRARELAEREFIALKRFAEGLTARSDEHSLAEQVKRADELVAELAEPAARRRLGRPKKEQP